MTQQQYILPAVIGEYLEELKVIRHCSPLTLEAYALDLSQFCQNLDKDKKLNTVSSADVQCWVIQLHAAGNAASSIGRKLSALRAFYDWAILHEKLPELSTNPAKQVRRPRIKRPLPKALTVEQALVFAQSAAHNKEPDPECDPCIAARDQAMIGLLYDCGLRRAELIALDYRFIENKHYRSQAWIDCAACEVHVKGKGNKSRVLPLGRQTLSEISSWLALRHQMLSSANASSEALFLGKHGARISASAVAQALKNRSRNRATGKIHPHMLRHSFASHILQSSSDLRGVQELLGHERIATTQIYTRLDFHHLSDAYAKAHPRAKRETR